MRLLLLSNSSSSAGFLVHAHAWIEEVLAGARQAVFVPFAGVTISWDDYADRVRDAMRPLGVSIVSAHEVEDGPSAVAEADAVIIGGGNTFALLHEMYGRELLPAIRNRVAAGAPYVGWSAGSNVACPTIRTTNDMPIVEPPSLDALGLVPFQINPHYTVVVPPGHRGETRDERLAEFVEMNPGLPVVGLPEGAALRAGALTLERLGEPAVRLFRHGAAPRDVRDTDLGFLLAGGAW